MVKQVPPANKQEVIQKGAKKDLQQKVHTVNNLNIVVGVNDLLLVPAKTCTQCEQSTHRIDRQLREQPAELPIGVSQLLRWKNVYRGKKEMPEICRGNPNGFECYDCFATRRKYFGISLAELQEQRKETTVDTLFYDSRAKVVNGEEAGDQVIKFDCKTIVTKSRKDFKEEFEEGTLQELWSFAAERRLPYNRDQKEELIQHIKQKMNKNVVENENGLLCVEVPDTPSDKTRYRRGVEHARKNDAATEHRSAQSAQEHWLDLKMNTAEEEAIQNQGHRVSSNMSTFAIGGGLASTAGSVNAGAASVGSARRRLTGKVSPLRPSQAPAELDPESDEQGSHHPESDASDSDDQDGCASVTTKLSGDRRPKHPAKKDSVADVKKKKRTNREIAFQEAAAHKEKILKKITFDFHWKGKKFGKRELNAVTSRMHKHARKVGAVAGSTDADADEYLQLSESLFSTAESLDTRDACFKKLKDDFPNYINAPLPQQHYDIIVKDAPMAWLSTLLSEKLSNMLQKTVDLPRDLGDILRTLKCSSEFRGSRDDPKRLSLSMVPVNEALAVQRSLILAIADKVWSQGKEEEIFQIAHVLEEHAPNLKAVLALPDDSQQHVDGFFPQPGFDIQCLRICCATLRESSSPTGQFGMRELRNECVLLVNNEHRLSARIKTHFRHINGDHISLGRKSWLKIKEMHAQASVDTADDTVVCAIAVVEKFNLDEMHSHEGNIDRANALIDFVETEGHDKFARDVQVVGKMFGYSQPPALEDQSSEDAELRSKGEVVAKEFAEKSYNVVAKSLEQTQNFTAYMGVVHDADGFSNPEEEDECTDFSLSLGLVGLMCHFDYSQRSLSFNTLLAELHERMKLTWLLEQVKAKYYWGKQEPLAKFSATQISLWISLHADQLQTTNRYASTVKYKDVPSGDKFKQCCLWLRAVQGEVMARGIRTVLCDMAQARIGIDSPGFEIAQQKEALMPMESKKVLDAIKVLDRCKSAHCLIEQGKAGGTLVGLAKLLSDVASQEKETPDVFDSLPVFRDMIGDIRADFFFNASAYCRNVQVDDLVDAFENKYKPTEDAIEKWDFKECSWLTKPLPQDEQTMTRNMEAAIGKWNTWKTTIECMNKEIHGMNEAASKMLSVAMEKLSVNTAKVRSAANMLASAIITSKLLAVGTEGKKHLEGARQYVKQQLMVLEHELPKALVAKLKQYDNTGSIMRDGKVAKASADQPALEGDEALSRPSRKFRKLGQVAAAIL